MCVRTGCIKKGFIYEAVWSAQRVSPVYYHNLGLIFVVAVTKFITKIWEYHNITKKNTDRVRNPSSQSIKQFPWLLECLCQTLGVNATQIFFIVYLLAFPEISIVMTTEQTPFGDEDCEMQLKISEKPNMWTVS